MPPVYRCSVVRLWVCVCLHSDPWRPYNARGPTCFRETTSVEHSAGQVEGDFHARLIASVRRRSDLAELLLTWPVDVRYTLIVQLYAFDIDAIKYLLLSYIVCIACVQKLLPLVGDGDSIMQEAAAGCISNIRRLALANQKTEKRKSGVAKLPNGPLRKSH